MRGVEEFFQTFSLTDLDVGGEIILKQILKEEGFEDMKPDSSGT
jgi:hypothetical protein